MNDRAPISPLLELLKYTAASGMALALDYSVYWLLAGPFGVSIGISAMAGYAIGMLLAYLLMTFGVFSNTDGRRRRAAEAMLFIVSGMLGLGLTYVVATTVSLLTDENLHAAKLAAVAVSFVAVYLFRRFVVFRSGADRQQQG